MDNLEFDIIVVGGGHAGCEAAWAAAGMGRATALVTLDPDKIGAMSCNPAMGGIGKGQLIREIDALGGLMAQMTDHTGIHFRRLNTKKGPAVQAPRAQTDRHAYQRLIQNRVESHPNLTVLKGEATTLLLDGKKVTGVVLNGKENIKAEVVVLTTGTFLGGLIHIGMKNQAGGRMGEAPALSMSDCLRNIGFPLNRLKTGTPPRLKSDSIDFSKTEEQPGDEPTGKFSFRESPAIKNHVHCHITQTSLSTHEVIKNNLDQSPLFSGVIKGIGPRYCPSIEDKVKKFPDKDSHQIFLEPESLETDWIYPNGIPTSLPFPVQMEFLKTIPGLENVEVHTPGYAIEYDCVNPTLLKPWLETKQVENLFFAGQINGTTGYEEAGAQGIMAGINAAKRVNGEEPFVLSRNEAYIGVLIDDLVTKGTEEPYRLFTSRVEYRLLLRQDNANFRLMDYGYEFGLIDQDVYDNLDNEKSLIENATQTLNETFVYPSEETKKIMGEAGAGEIKGRTPMSVLLKRPGMNLKYLIQLGFDPSPFTVTALEQVEIGIKYEGYIRRQMADVERMKKWEKLKIPPTIDYLKLTALKTEAREKLNKLKPVTLGQASRITGISPTDLAIIQFQIEQGHKK